MKFLARRTSIGSYGGSQPFEEAVEVTDKAHAVPSDEDRVWVVELNTLDDLHAFIDKHKESVVIGRAYAWMGDADAELFLELYDDYRE